MWSLWYCMTSIRSDLIQGVAGALVVAGLVVPGAAEAQQGAPPPWRWSPVAGEPAVEVVMVFISSPEVAANSDPGFGALVRAAKDHVAAVASGNDQQFAAVGVALSWDPRQGIDYLLDGVAGAHQTHDFGPWDEVHAGRNWLNEVVVDRLWRAAGHSGDLPITGVPQADPVQ
jgi:hypothetical protein